MIPPWPEKIVTIASGICVIVVLLLFYGIRHQSKTRKRLWGRALFCLSILAFIGWLVSVSFLVVPLTDEYRVFAVLAFTIVYSRELQRHGLNPMPRVSLKRTDGIRLKISGTVCLSHEC